MCCCCPMVAHGYECQKLRPCRQQRRESWAWWFRSKCRTRAPDLTLTPLSLIFRTNSVSISVMSHPLFPTIGSVAAKTNQLPHNLDIIDETSTNDDRPLEEVESLCMKCGEQVSEYNFNNCTPYWYSIAGYDSDALDFYPILP